MAKYKTNGLISEISGSMGNKTFSRWNGIPIIKKKKRKHKTVNTAAMTKIKEIFGFLTRRWVLMSFKEQALWCAYAKRNKRIKGNRRNGLMWAIGNWYSGKIAFMSVNQLLMISGFRFLQKPLFGRSQPPLAATDLPGHSEWKENIKFKVWLPREYEDRCVVQIWLKKLSSPSGTAYITSVVPISTSPTEIKIEKIRFYERKGGKGKTVEKNLSEVGYCKMYLQMRTIAENGRFSVPGAIHKIELSREPLPSCGEVLSKYCVFS